MSSFATEIAVVGDKGVGKACLRGQYLEHIFPSNHREGFSLRIENIGGSLTQVILWLETNPRGIVFSLVSAKGILVVFDLTNRSSFTNIGCWMAEIYEHEEAGVVKVLVGNKCDVVGERVVSKHEAEEFAASHGMVYFETTATDHESTRAPFDHVVRTVVKEREAAMTGLQRAASAGDVVAIENAVGGQVGEMDVGDIHGCTLMHHASKNGHVGVIEALVRLGSNALDTPDNNGWTPMMTAVHYEQVSVMESLVRLGSNAIDTPNNDGWTPLYAAAWNGHANVIETLVRLGSNAIDTPDIYGCTPLHTATLKGHVNVIETLVRLGSNAIDTPDEGGCVPLHTAISKENVNVIEALVRLGSKTIDTPNNDGWTPLYAAASSGHVNVIETLVRLGSKAIDTPNNYGWTPMHEAIESNSSEAVETLVRLGSRVLDTPDIFFRQLWHFGNPRDNTIKVLKALGVSHEKLERRRVDLSEDEVADVRYRVYFCRSLTNRLLHALQSPSINPQSRQTFE